ncbi:MAG: hypothetical protein K9N23_02980 [Akkermansiaceae bacterium]|nr:hypothetical protein [Akkermansiaceae bacterium]
MKNSNLKTHPPGANPSRPWPFRLAAKTSALAAAVFLTVGSQRASAQDPDLLYSALSSAYTGSGNWTLAESDDPGIVALTPMGSPGTRTINGQNWVVNKAEGDGFKYTNVPQPNTLPFNGGSIVVAARPVRYSPGSNYQCLVSNLLFQFSLCVQRDTGQLKVIRQGAWYDGPSIPNGQITVFSVVVQNNGTFKVFLNGDPTPVMDITDTSAFSNLTASEWYGTDVSVGKGWNGDGWSSFNGDIGDVYVYKVAIDDTKREALEDSLIAKYGTATNYTVTATTGTGGSVSPSGAVDVPQNTDKTFTISTNYGYLLNDVVVDTVSQGPITSYTFTDVTANHTIDVTWTALPTISGSVVGPTSDPVYSASVSLSTHPDGSLPITTRQTDSLGNYAIVVPGDDTYYLVARKGGMVTSDPLMVVLSGSSVPDQNFMLDASAGLDPLVVLDASSLTAGALTSWPNGGTIGGTFDSIDGVQTPTVDSSYGIQAVKFVQDAATRQTLAGSIPTPPQITGSSDWSVSTKLYKLDANQNSDNFYLSWAGGDWGCRNTAAFAYRNDGYALTHWCWDIWFDGGQPTQGTWHVVTITYDGNAEKIYVDGVLNRTDYPGALSIHDAGVMLVGGRLWHDARGEDQYWRFNGAIANLQIFDQALTASQVLQVVDQQNGAEPRIVSGTITDAGGLVEGAAVTLKNGATVVAGPYTTGSDGTYTLSAGFTDGDTCTVSASFPGDFPGTLDVPITTGVTDYPNSDILLANDPSYDPDLLFVAKSTDLTDGASWPLSYPPSGAMTRMGTPVPETIGGVQWEKNVYTSGDGYRLGTYADPIPVNGASIVAVVKPQYRADGGWGCVFNGFYNDLMLNVEQVTGQIKVVRKGQWYDGPILADGQEAILSLVVQPDGQLKLYVDGAQVMSITDAPGYTQMSPGGWDGGYNYNGTLGFAHAINVGRNDPDGWSTYNGNIGDVYVYKTAIDTTKRKDLQDALAAKFGITLPVFNTITATADANGTISPSGDVDVVEGASQTFTFTGTAGFVDVVTVDGTPVGNPASYTFDNVTGPHTIDVTFTVEPAPANDNFAGAIDLPGNSGTQTGTHNFATTIETGEPDIYGATNTVWFKWTAPADGDLTVGTWGSTNLSAGEWDSMIGLYTGVSVDALTPVDGQTPMDTGSGESMTVAVTSGTTYYLQTAGYLNETAANILITWSFAGSSSPYGTWAAAYAGGQTPDLDFNHDGVANGIAYFMGMNGLATHPGPVSGTVTWPYVNEVTSYEVQTSSNLADWTPVAPTTDTGVGGVITYDLPTGQGKVFCRLMVTP